jgi:hypothetical protein
MAQSLAAVLLLCASCVGPARAASFLHAKNDEVEIMSPELQSTLMNKVSEMLRGNEGALSEDHLTRIEDGLRTTVKAMPTNKEGKLDHSAVRFTLHSYFVQRHAWYVRGLSDVGEGGFKLSSPGRSTFQDRVEEFVQGIFEQRFGNHGLGLREMALLVATFENLVHQETMQRLNYTYKVLEKEKVMVAVREMNASQVETVMETYMMSYILRMDFSRLRSGIGALHLVRERIPAIYPAWGETKAFLQDVLAQNSQHRSFFTHSDVEDIIGQVGDQYGRWQDRECHDLKRRLLVLEDKSIGINGSGRVRIADFYRSAMNDGNWQFVESKEYLTQLGALDVSDPSIPRVIIPNYINSPSNCVAGSKYYSVCCINECDDLLDNLEHTFAAPTAPPMEIARVVANLGSSTVPAGRNLNPILLGRLEEIARHHGGQVPLHGRLFAQWLHHAYPRECPYPHITGSVRAQRVDEVSRETQRVPTLSKQELKQAVEMTSADEETSEYGGSDEVTVWSHHEELYVSGGASASAVNSAGMMQSVRPLIYSMALFGMAAKVWQRFGSVPKMAFSGHGSKDVFV